MSTFRSYRGDTLPASTTAKRSLWDRLVEFVLLGIPWRERDHVNLFALDGAIGDLRRVLDEIPGAIGDLRRVLDEIPDEIEGKHKLFEALDRIEADMRSDG